jgi:hypothetical protein
MTIEEMYKDPTYRTMATNLEPHFQDLFFSEQLGIHLFQAWIFTFPIYAHDLAEGVIKSCIADVFIGVAVLAYLADVSLTAGRGTSDARMRDLGLESGGKYYAESGDVRV